ncbi:MAG: hypothetical protein GY772_06630, partial [bacterium]|nr:hypothetical protein [bacterium]
DASGADLLTTSTKPRAEEAEPTGRQVHRAMQLREKYRLPGGKKILPPDLVGFDAENRDGIPLNGLRCDAPLGEIATMGWHHDEANFENICVEERPGSDALLKYNNAICASQEYLADVTSNSMHWGTISHSHLHQCLKNILGGAKAREPSGLCRGGHLSLEIVAGEQPALAQDCRCGLEWEVLSWRVRDDPGAVRLIQSACNRKGSAQLRETDMQAVARLSWICTSMKQPGSNGVSFAAAKDALAKTMPHLAGSGDFLGMLRFVVTLGAEGAPFIRDLKTFVGLRGENRAVRSSTFANVAHLPQTLPHVMVGLIVMAYTAPASFFVDGYSRFLTAADIRLLCDRDASIPSADALLGERILRYFHRACGKAKVFADLTNPERLDFLCALDACLCRSLTGKHLGVRQESCPTLLRVAQEFYEDLRKLSKAKLPEPSWPAPTPVPPCPRARGTAPPALEPKVISFRDGEAVDAQESYEETITTEVVPWTRSLPSLVQDCARSQLLLDLAALERQFRPEGQADKVEIRRSSNGAVHVVAARDLVAGELALPPMVPSLHFLALAGKPGVVQASAAVTVPPCFGGEALVISPCTRLPPRGVLLEDWGKEPFADPGWLMQRSTNPGTANCSLVYIPVNAIARFGVGIPPPNLGKASVQDHRKGELPLLTNHKALRSGGELILTCSEVTKRARQGKAVQWHDTVGRPAKSSRT